MTIDTLPRALKADVLIHLARRLVDGVDPTDPAAVRRLYEEVGGETGLTDPEVKAVAHRHGWPRPASMQDAARILRTGANPAPAKSPAAAPPANIRFVPTTIQPTTGTAPPPAGNPTEQLLLRAEKSDKRSTRIAAQRIHKALDDLAERLANETAAKREEARKKAEKAAAAAAAKKAREEAAAEVALLEKRLREAKAKLRGSAAASTPTVVGADAKTIRAWAAANGVECPSRGVVPAAVREAYEAAS